MNKVVKNKSRIFVGLSGGVDSAVAAALLKDQGYDVAGAFMRFWGEAGHRENGCCSASAEAAARLVAAKLDIPFYVFDVKAEFKKKVVDYFLRELRAGRTPNPCVVCNPQIKFGLFLKYVLKMGADYIATGHYARLKPRSVILSTFASLSINSAKNLSVQKENRSFGLQPQDDKKTYKLFRAKDDKKDQSYFLVGLKQEQLSKIIFPLGDYLKREVYDIAIKKLLPYRQGESFDICFIDDYQQFLKKYLKMKSGEIISPTGYVLGQHQGLPLSTIGQRVNIGGPGPFYLVKKDVKKNILYVSNNEKDLLEKEMRVEKVNWLSGQAPKIPFKCKIKIRYGSDMTEAVIARSRRRRGNPVGDSDKSGLLRSARNDAVTVIFSRPQRAITPGQIAVFYGKDGEMIGGGVIL